MQVQRKQSALAGELWKGLPGIVASLDCTRMASSPKIEHVLHSGRRSRRRLAKSQHRNAARDGNLFDEVGVGVIP